MAEGIKEKDDSHIACAIKAKSDYFLSTDDGVLKYKNDNIIIANPIEFISKGKAMNSTVELMDRGMKCHYY